MSTPTTSFVRVLPGGAAAVVAGARLYRFEQIPAGPRTGPGWTRRATYFAFFGQPAAAASFGVSSSIVLSQDGARPVERLNQFRR